MPNPDCTLSAQGYGSINVPIITLDIGLSITATEDQGRDNRIYYPMQVQKDQFSISAVFASKETPTKGTMKGVKGANDFNSWIWKYVEYASTPGANLGLGMRVQVPVRSFDMMGFPVQGWSYKWAPLTLTDVTWVVTIAFDGASQVGAIPRVPKTSVYGPPPEPDINNTPPNLIDQLMFYPPYYDQNASKQYTGDPSDQMYRSRK